MCVYIYIYIPRRHNRAHASRVTNGLVEVCCRQVLCINCICITNNVGVILIALWNNESWCDSTVYCRIMWCSPWESNPWGYYDDTSNVGELVYHWWITTNGGTNTNCENSLDGTEQYFPLSFSKHVCTHWSPFGHRVNKLRKYPWMVWSVIFLTSS